MPLTLQVKLLRVSGRQGIQSRGSSKVLHSDFRLVSATNRNLVRMVASGCMREDFYYRISTVPILMPPLRDRLDDLPLLVDHFMQLFADETVEKTPVSSQLIQKLECHDWPGNVRELIKRYQTLSHA